MIDVLESLLIAAIVLASTCLGLIPRITDKFKRSRRRDAILSDNKQRTAVTGEERPPNFFMNSVSFAISFQTIISSLGLPVEFYHYGFRTYQYTISMILGPIIIAVFFVPFIYKIKSKSLYDYLDDKFDGSLAVKKFTMAMAILTQFVYLSIIMLSTGICVMQIISVNYPIQLWPVVTLIGVFSAALAILGNLIFLSKEIRK
jgi:Na+(H+)/acetate symporter ActP